MDDVEPALEVTRHFKIGNVYHQPEKQGRFSTYPTWPYGSVACIVEVDPETGYFRVLRYVLVHDAGKIINPLLANANLHGAIAQGIGGAVYEEIVYDEAGQPLTSTFMDYTIPTAVEVPMVELAPRGEPVALHAARRQGRRRVGRRRRARRPLQRDRERIPRARAVARLVAADAGAGVERAGGRPGAGGCAERVTSANCFEGVL